MSISDKLTTIAENEQKVYEAGRTKEWSDFWDDFQQKGNRVNYSYAFWQSGWSDVSFRPKHDIKTTNGEFMFSQSTITDMKGILEECNVKLDTSMTARMQNAFNNCIKLKRLPEISFESATMDTRIQNAFAGDTQLEYIDKVIYPSNVYLATTNTFSNCRSLTHLRIAGPNGAKEVIGKDFNVSWSPLDVESVKDVILHLKDYSTDSTNKGKYILTLSDTSKTAMSELGTIPEFNNKTYDAYLTDIGWNLA